MAYRFIVLPDAEKQIRAFDSVVARRIVKKLQWLASQDDPLRLATVLHNSKIGDARFRIGDYRAIALVDLKGQRIAIVAVGHRREIYR